MFKLRVGRIQSRLQKGPAVDRRQTLAFPSENGLPPRRRLDYAVANSQGDAPRFAWDEGECRLSYRLEVQSQTFHCQQRPSAETGEVEASIETALRAFPGPPPALLYWDLDLFAGSEPVGELKLGRGGIDPLLLQEYDLGACLAVSEAAMTSLVGRGALNAARDLHQAANLLLRSPATRSLYCPNLRARADIMATKGRNAVPRRTGGDTLTIALLSVSASDQIDLFLDALALQEFNSRLELLVMISGGGAGGGKQRAQAVDSWAAENKTIRVRRYMVSGEFDQAYLANTAAALAAGDVLLLADPVCRPLSPTLMQTLADWAFGGDTATATPRIESGDRLLAAGLSLAETADGATILTPFADDVFSDGARLAAAPSPWLFAVRRRAWIEGGGIPVTSGALWTSPLASDLGPKGRHVVVGSVTAEWIGDGRQTDGLAAAAPARLRTASASALRGGARTLWLPAKPRATEAARRAKSPAAKPPDEPVAAFSDAGLAASATRLLVFADAFGPSQSIAFIEGLASARARDEVAVRIVAEARLTAAADRMVDLVDAEFALAQPTIVVVSRLADQAIWRAVQRAARARGLPIIFHIDDDLFDLPVILGADRYRLARHPRRIHTLHEILAQCDLTLAATPALAARIEALGAPGRVVSMPIGSAGLPPDRRLPRKPSDRLTIAYMGSASHNHDLEMVIPALNQILKAYPHVDVALFGSIAKQPAARLIGTRLKTHAGVFGDYMSFKKRLSELQFDIGLAPLRDISFNQVKTPTKWIEYAEAGIPVIASAVSPYLPIAEAGALVAAQDDAWEPALRDLVEDPSRRESLVTAADELLRREFSWSKLEDGMLSILRPVQTRAEAA